MWQIYQFNLIKQKHFIQKKALIVLFAVYIAVSGNIEKALADFIQQGLSEICKGFQKSVRAFSI